MPKEGAPQNKEERDYQAEKEEVEKALGDTIDVIAERLKLTPTQRKEVIDVVFNQIVVKRGEKLTPKRLQKLDPELAESIVNVIAARHKEWNKAVSPSILQDDQGHVIGTAGTLAEAREKLKRERELSEDTEKEK